MSSSSEALTWAWRQEIPRRPLTKLVLVALAGETTRVKDGPFEADPGVDRLVRLTSMNEATIRRHLRWLVEQHVISKSSAVDANGHRQRDRYTLPIVVVTSVAHRAQSQPAESPLGREPTGTRARSVRPDSSNQTGTDVLQCAESPVGGEPGQVLKDEELKTKPKNKRSPSTATDFETFWSVYPRRVGKRGAESEFERAVKRASVEAVLAGAERYRDDPHRQDQYTKHPSTWLHQDCWEDDPLPAARTRGPRDVSPDGLSYTGTDGVVRQMPPSGRFRAE